MRSTYKGQSQGMHVDCGSPDVVIVPGGTLQTGRQTYRGMAKPIHVRTGAAVDSRDYARPRNASSYQVYTGRTFAINVRPCDQCDGEDTFDRVTRFENFQRDVASGLGTGDMGFVWDERALSGAAVSVISTPHPQIVQGYARFAMSAGGVATYRVTGSGQWTRDSWLVFARFRPSAVTAGASLRLRGIGASGSITARIDISTTGGVGKVWIGGVSAGYVAFTANAWHVLMWEHKPGGDSVTVARDGTFPAFGFYATTAAFSQSVVDFELEVVGGSSAVNVDVDYVVFENWRGIGGGDVGMGAGTGALGLWEEFKGNIGLRFGPSNYWCDGSSLYMIGGSDSDVEYLDRRYWQVPIEIEIDLELVNQQTPVPVSRPPLFASGLNDIWDGGGMNISVQIGAVTGDPASAMQTVLRLEMDDSRGSPALPEYFVNPSVTLPVGLWNGPTCRLKYRVEDQDVYVKLWDLAGAEPAWMIHFTIADWAETTPAHENVQDITTMGFGTLTAFGGPALGPSMRWEGWALFGGTGEKGALRVHRVNVSGCIPMPTSSCEDGFDRVTYGTLGYSPIRTLAWNGGDGEYFLQQRCDGADGLIYFDPLGSEVDRAYLGFGSGVPGTRFLSGPQTTIPFEVYFEFTPYIGTTPSYTYFDFFFGRTIAPAETAGWGTADSGAPWTLAFYSTFHPSSSSEDVDGTRGRLEVINHTFPSTQGATGETAPLPLTLAAPFTMISRNRYTYAVTNGSVGYFMSIMDPTLTQGPVWALQTGDSGEAFNQMELTVYDSLGNVNAFGFAAASDLTAGVWFTTEMFVSDTLVTLKWWKDGDPVPSSPQISVVPTVGVFDTGWVVLDSLTALSNENDVTFGWETSYIQFTTEVVAFWGIDLMLGNGLRDYFLSVDNYPGDFPEDRLAIYASASPDAFVDDLVGVTGVDGVPIAMRFRIESTQVLGKIWRVSDGEPSPWNITQPASAPASPLELFQFGWSWDEPAVRTLMMRVHKVRFEEGLDC